MEAGAWIGRDVVVRPSHQFQSLAEKLAAAARKVREVSVIGVIPC